MEIPSVFPEKVSVFGLFEVSSTVCTAIVVSLIIIILAVIFRYVVLRNFKAVPKGVQNVLEIVIESINKFCTGVMGEKGKNIAPYILTLFAFIIISGFSEYIGIRSPMTDLNFTIGIALMSFVLIIAFSIKHKGAVGWIKTYAQPKAFMFPINVLTSLAIPISLACRLFGNLFSGLVVMDMIYSGLGYFAIGIPALASLYFILFHLGMQAYVFTMLTMSFIHEKIE